MLTVLRHHPVSSGMPMSAMSAHIWASGTGYYRSVPRVFRKPHACTSTITTITLPPQLKGLRTGEAVL